MINVESLQRRTSQCKTEHFTYQSKHKMLELIGKLHAGIRSFRILQTKVPPKNYFVGILLVLISF